MPRPRNNTPVTVVEITDFADTPDAKMRFDNAKF
jgi:hypothetical protein